jgi:hypothetical protein
MIGVMHYNRTNNSGFTDNARGRCAPGINTCPVCLLPFDAGQGQLPDGSTLPQAQWQASVCKTIKDDTVNGGFQGGCLAGTYAPF